MSESVGTLIKVAASIVVASAVVAFVWFAVGENIPSPDETDGTLFRTEQIRSQELCDALGQTWTPAGDPDGTCDPPAP